MTKEEWELMEDMLDGLLLRFQEYDLEIAKLKLRIKQLERQKDDQD